MATLGRCLGVSLLAQCAAALVVFIGAHIPLALAPKGPPGPKRIEGGDYLTYVVLPVTATAVRLGLLAVAVAAAWWAFGLWRMPELRGGRNVAAMRATLVLVPLCVALAYPVLLFLLHPGFFRASTGPFGG
jgi:uncharacterized membrane protein YwzB